MKKIKKVIFPVGGLGTRFLPATKSMPKEMLPVACKPLIQYAFEEAIDAGIEQFIFITGRNKNVINNHFDHSYELQKILNESEKKAELDLTRGWLPEPGKIIFIRQQVPLGLGHAIWCARDVIGDEPFTVILADEMIKTPGGFLKQMLNLSEEHEHKINIVAVGPVPMHETSRYGIISSENLSGPAIKLSDIVEKPAATEAPSNLSVAGRYVLQPEIFDYLAKFKIGKNNEIQITDSIRQMLHDKQNCWALRFDGPRFDCGNKLGFLDANIAYSLDDPEIKDEVKSTLSRYI